jgi:hypothetical protein
MTKKPSNPTTEVQEETGRDTPKRRKVYQRNTTSEIPEYVKEHFAKDDWELRLVRWTLNGTEDYKNLSYWENEGYEFVDMTELPEKYRKQLRSADVPHRQGLVISGDLCLMKVDKDLKKSREEAFQEATDRELAAVDVHILEKRGFRNLGTKTRVAHKEPSFQD